MAETRVTTLDPWAQATGGVFGDPWCQATSGVFCVQPAAFKPPGAGRKRRKYYADDVDLEKSRARTRLLRDQRDLRDLRDLLKLFLKLEEN